VKQETPLMHAVSFTANAPQLLEHFNEAREGFAKSYTYSLQRTLLLLNLYAREKRHTEDS
jgi:hypothetical protein